jgi:glycosyltransferase involved in cell wall biosynthesis
MVIAPWARRLGGAETMLATYIDGFDRTRFELHVVFLEPGPWAEDLAARGHRVTTVAAARLREVRHTTAAVRAIAARVRSERPHVLLSWSAKSHLYGASAAALCARPVPAIWWQHMISQGSWLDRLATALPTAAIGCSSRACEQAQQRLRPRRRTFVVHPGIASNPGAAAGARSYEAPAAGPWTVGLVGNLQPWKGQDVLLAAQAKLRAEGRQVRVLLVGGDPYRRGNDYVTRLRALIARLRLEDAVELTGHVADVAPLLARMDLLVSASTGEPFGIALLEAMAAGVPVVAVNDGGPAEIVVAGSSGLLVDGPRADALADALRRLMGDRDLRRRLGSGGRARVASEFTAERMCRQIEGQVELLAAGR